jgi:hypothetical protein
VRVTECTYSWTLNRLSYLYLCIKVRNRTRKFLFCDGSKCDIITTITTHSFSRSWSNFKHDFFLILGKAGGSCMQLLCCVMLLHLAVIFICLLYKILATNSEYLCKQQVGLCNWDNTCVLWGRSWIFCSILNRFTTKVCAILSHRTSPVPSCHTERRLHLCCYLKEGVWEAGNFLNTLATVIFSRRPLLLGVIFSCGDKVAGSWKRLAKGMKGLLESVQIYWG